MEAIRSALENRYGVERELGQGGMATVYLAQDLKHNRKVAVKVLRPELAAIIGAERFLQEIEVTASLQHPHILPLFDSGKTVSFLYYVMPHVEGESLREKLAREKQLGADEAVEIVKAVAEALQYAHERGIVHRDIKPANILFQSGQPVVADFGIALAVTAAGGARITETGLSLGTPHYMSPEQASGDREVDARSDIYSLGCVLYEMLVGDPPHTGSTLQSVLAKVLSEDPRPISRFRSTVPRNVEATALKALAKAPADRFSSAASFTQALADPAFGVGEAQGRVSAQSRETALRSWLPWALAGVAAVFGLLGWLRPAPVADVSRFSLRLPVDQPLAIQVGRTVAVSPDGHHLIYRGTGPLGTMLLHRERDELEGRPLPGTEGASSPFFSPDGEWIGFFADSRLKKIPLGGGPPVILTDAGANRGGTWTGDGHIVYSPSTGEGLWRILAEGGTPEQLTAPRTELGEASHRWPDALPGSEAVIMTIFTGNPEEGSVAAYDLGEDQITILVPGAFYGRWVPTGHLAYATTEGTLLVQPFDPQTLKLSGGAVALAEGVALSLASSAADFSIARNGTMILLRAVTNDALVRVDRDGSEEILVDDLHGSAESLRFSPDGGSIVLGLNGDVWVLDLAGNTLSRRTFEGTNRYPNWTPDGERISFTSRRPGTKGLDLMAKSADGSGQAEVLFAADHEQYEHEWTRGGSLVVRQTVPETGRDIWHVPLDDSSEPGPLVMSRFNERSIALSPDERWLAYVSDESGTAEVYVRPFPGPAGKWLISANGGVEPAWSADGQELFYRSGENVVAARLEIGSTVRVKERVVLFEDPYGTNTDHTDYDVHPTEGWFVFTRSAGPPPELIWVDNWFAEVRERVGG